MKYGQCCEPTCEEAADWSCWNEATHPAEVWDSCTTHLGKLMEVAWCLVWPWGFNRGTDDVERYEKEWGKPAIGTTCPTCGLLTCCGEHG